MPTTFLMHLDRFFATACAHATAGSAACAAGAASRHEAASSEEMERALARLVKVMVTLPGMRQSGDYASPRLSKEGSFTRDAKFFQRKGRKFSTLCAKT